MAGSEVNARLLSRYAYPPDETFVYDVDFLIFLKAALGRLNIRRVGARRYKAELVAETKGFIGFLTGYRKNHYVSEMDYEPEEKRLISRRYTKIVHRGSDVSRTVMEIDYPRRAVRWKTLRNGALLDSGSEPIPDGTVYEDLLSAFFNLRLGAFGPVRPGRSFRIVTLPAYDTPRERGKYTEPNLARDFFVRLADPPTERRYRRRFGREKERGILALVKVPKELFGQKTGEVRVWMDENLIPVAATVERAILFGDVSGTLRKAIVIPPRDPR